MRTMSDNFEYFSFEGLNVYREIRRLVVLVYKISETFPSSEKFALTSQLRRAIISVASNIAEGSGRFSYKEKIHFIEIAYGSLMEAYCQLQLAVDTGMINEDSFNEIRPNFHLISRLLTGLRNSFTQKLNQNH